MMHAFVTVLFFAAYVSPVFVIRGVEAISRAGDKQTSVANA
jgi:hypothetical protein